MPLSHNHQDVSGFHWGNHFGNDVDINNFAQLAEPTESERKVMYPEDDAEGVLTKLFVLPLLSPLLRCFWCPQSAPAAALAPPPVLGLLDDPAVCWMRPGEPTSQCGFPSRVRSLQLFPEPHTPGLFFPAGLSALGETWDVFSRLLLLLYSESRLRAWGSHSKSVSRNRGRMTVCWSYTLGISEMLDARRGLFLGLGSGVSSIKLITSSRLKHRSSSS